MRHTRHFTAPRGSFLPYPSSVGVSRMRRSLGVPGCVAALAALLAIGTTSLAADRTFPFDSELLLDAKPMKGSKRVPIMTVARNGEAEIDLWCNSVQGQIVVVDS